MSLSDPASLLPASRPVGRPDQAGTRERPRGDGLERGLFATAPDAAPPQWLVAASPVAYPDAVAFMEQRVSQIAAGEADECVWLVEHPPLYTAGTSARDHDLTDPHRLPVFRSSRGGQFTYHGPGQRVCYVMLDLNRRRCDVRAFVLALEDWLIDALWAFHIRGERRDDRVGVWVRRPESGPLAEEKIAAIGVRVRRWVTFHGVSLNVDPDLGHFDGIVPCGVRNHGVTSLVDLGLPVTMSDVDLALRSAFEATFGPTRDG